MRLQNTDRNHSKMPGQPAPALRLRRLRRAYSEEGLRPDGLAYLTGIPPQGLAAYESDRVLPGHLEDLVLIAAAFQVPLDEVIDQRVLARLRARVADRRLTLEGGEEKPPIGFRCPAHE